MIGGRIYSAAQVDSTARADGDTVLAVVDAAAIGEDVDIGALGAKLAVALGHSGASQYHYARFHLKGPGRKPQSQQTRLDSTLPKRGEKQRGTCMKGRRDARQRRQRNGRERRTFAKYLQTFSVEVPISWLNGQAFPAWQAPWRKNLQGT